MFRLEGISPIYLGLSENHAPTIQMISPNYPAIRCQKGSENLRSAVFPSGVWDAFWCFLHGFVFLVIFYFPNGQSTIWGIYSEYLLFCGNLGANPSLLGATMFKSIFFSWSEVWTWIAWITYPFFCGWLDGHQCIMSQLLLPKNLYGRPWHVVDDHARHSESPCLSIAYTHHCWFHTNCACTVYMYCVYIYYSHVFPYVAFPDMDHIFWIKCRLYMLHIHTHTYVYIYIYIHTHHIINIYICTYIYIHIYIYVSPWLW